MNIWLRINVFLASKIVISVKMEFPLAPNVDKVFNYLKIYQFVMIFVEMEESFLLNATIIIRSMVTVAQAPAKSNKTGSALGATPPKKTVANPLNCPK